MRPCTVWKLTIQWLVSSKASTPTLSPSLSLSSAEAAATLTMSTLATPATESAMDPLLSSTSMSASGALTRRGVEMLSTGRALSSVERA